jgi:hypothetical protein
VSQQFALRRYFSQKEKGVCSSGLRKEAGEKNKIKEGE